MSETEEAKKELEFHRWLCDESYQHLDKVKQHMWRLEVERAKRYGRTDTIAVKADNVLWGVRNQLDGLIDIIDKLEEEDPPK